MTDYDHFLSTTGRQLAGSAIRQMGVLVAQEAQLLERLGPGHVLGRRPFLPQVVGEELIRRGLPAARDQPGVAREPPNITGNDEDVTRHKAPYANRSCNLLIC